MPTFEGQCNTKKCKKHGKVFDYLLRSWKESDPLCPACSKPVDRLASAPAVIWAKDMGQYCGENTEGHYAYATDEKGKRIRKFISTRKEQKEFCKTYGYYDPAEIPSQPTATTDNVNSARNTAGESGGWI